MRPSLTLPPLVSLRVFEVAGRRLSFRMAGDELHITQSAVSHHVGRLERELGVPLFVRHARGVVLTTDGERYLHAVQDALATLSSATSAIRGDPRGDRRLRISVLPAFAANWLVPRLSRWQERHPEIELEIDPTLRSVDVAAGEADLAIRYGNGRWTNVSCKLLVQEHLTPVASPALLARGPDLLEPADILCHTLLFNAPPTDWIIWAGAAGIDLAKPRRLQLTDYSIVLQAALDGLGVALGRMLLVRSHLEAGSLVQPFGGTFSSSLAAYWLVTARRVPSPPLAALMTWIIGEAGESAPQRRAE